MSRDGERPDPERETHLRPAVFDQLRLAMKGDPSGLRELYRDYLTEAWRSVEALKQAIRQQDAKAVHAAAHYLKSSSLVLGAVQVAHEATMIEQAGDIGNLDDAAAGVRQTELRLKQVTARLVEELGAKVAPAGKTAA